MARISGIDLPRDKRIEIALTYIFGIGLPTAKKLLAQTGVSPDVRVKDLSGEDENKLREAVDAMKVEGDLRREIAGHIKRLTTSAATAACVTAADCPCAASERKRTRAPARAPSARWPAEESRQEVNRRTGPVPVLFI